MKRKYIDIMVFVTLIFTYRDLSLPTHLGAVGGCIL